MKAYLIESEGGRMGIYSDPYPMPNGTWVKCLRTAEGDDFIIASAQLVVWAVKNDLNPEKFYGKDQRRILVLTKNRLIGDLHTLVDLDAYFKHVDESIFCDTKPGCKFLSVWYKDHIKGGPWRPDKHHYKNFNNQIAFKIILGDEIIVARVFGNGGVMVIGRTVGPEIIREIVGVVKGVDGVFQNSPRLDDFTIMPMVRK